MSFRTSSYVISNILFCHFERSEKSPPFMFLGGVVGWNGGDPSSLSLLGVTLWGHFERSEKSPLLTAEIPRAKVLGMTALFVMSSVARNLLFNRKGQKSPFRTYPEKHIIMSFRTKWEISSVVFFGGVLRGCSYIPSNLEDPSQSRLGMTRNKGTGWSLWTIRTSGSE